MASRDLRNCAPQPHTQARQARPWLPKPRRLGYFGPSYSSNAPRPTHPRRSTARPPSGSGRAGTRAFWAGTGRRAALLVHRHSFGGFPSRAPSREAGIVSGHGRERARFQVPAGAGGACGGYSAGCGGGGVYGDVGMAEGCG